MSDLLSELGRLTEADEDADSAWSDKLAEINRTGPAEEPDTQTEPEAEAPAEADTVETEGQPRDELGKFTRVDTPPVDEHAREDELEAQEAAVEQPSDDRIGRLIQKYGSVEKALEAAADAQELIGRQGGEVGELRSQLEELQRQVQTQQTPQPQQQYRPITEADIERLDTKAMTEGGGRSALEEATALDPTGVLARRVYDTWAAVAPGEATAFLAEQIAEQRVSALREELKPSLAQTQEAQEQQQFVQVWQELESKRPEIGQLVPAMNQLLDENEYLARAINDADPKGKLELLGTLADAARARQAPEVQAQIAEFEAERAAASRDGKVAAQVVAPKAAIGSSPGGATETPKTQAQKDADRIRSGILESSDTSIHSGWTTE